MDAIRAFSLIAVLASVACAALSVLSMFSESIKWIMPFLAALVAGVCGFIAVIIYTAEVGGGNYGWSYFLGWVGGVLAFITSGISFATK